MKVYDDVRTKANLAKNQKRIITFVVNNDDDVNGLIKIRKGF